MAQRKEKFIQKAIKKPGALHRQLGIPEDETIPKSKLKAAAKKGNTKLAKRARLALTLEKLPHRGRKSSAKKSTAKKSTAKKSTARKSSTKKSAAKKSTARKSSSKSRARA
jgi:hypothetical protein